MTESVYTDNPLHSSVKNVRAFGKQLSLINLLGKMRISVFTHMETETQGSQSLAYSCTVYQYSGSSIST